MKVISAEFVISAAVLRPSTGSGQDRPEPVRGAVLRQAQHRPEPSRGAVAGLSLTQGIPHDGLAQVSLAGRSNVGKSSLINALARTRIARTSAAPGKTRLANVYRLVADGGAGGPGRWATYFVDLPGYGYARGGPSSADELRRVAEGYFREVDDEQRRAAFLLVDSRHPELESDVAAARWLDGMHVTRHIVATKIDKLSRTERARNLRTIGNVFGMAAVPVSVTSGEGLDALWTMIARLARDVAPRG